MITNQAFLKEGAQIKKPNNTKRLPRYKGCRTQAFNPDMTKPDLPGFPNQKPDGYAFTATKTIHIPVHPRKSAKPTEKAFGLNKLSLGINQCNQARRMKFTIENTE